MSGIKLVPEGGGEAIPVPDDSTVIGRGAFLKVTDKRVSRSHAKLQIIDGKLYLTPTHTNPCFLRRGGKGAQEVLQRDIRQCLENGDVFGLLPDQLFYTVTYADAPVNGVERNGDTKDKIKSQPLSPSSVKNGENDKQNESVKHDGVKEEEESEYKEESKDQVRPQIVSVVRADGKDMALPLEKKRILPDWMIKTAKAAQSPTSKTRKTTPATKPQHAATANRRPAMTESRRQRQVTEEEEDEDEEERSGKANKRRKPDSDEDYEDESEDESPRRSRKRSRKHVSDDDDDDDYEEEAPKQKRGKKRRKGSSDDDNDYELSRRGKRAGTRAQKHEDDDDDDDEPRGKRPQRAAKQKRGSYVDDFMVGEDFDDSDELPEKPDTDSDFEVDEEDSGSDWERGRGSQKNKRQASRTPARRGRKRKSKVDSDDEEEEDFDMSDEEYTPRPSRRRGGSTPAKKAAHKRKEQDDEDEEEEEEEEMEASPAQGNKARTPCWYGNKCYRKNPSHFKEFCHPGDDSYEEASGEDDGDEKQDEKRGESEEDKEEKR